MDLPATSHDIKSIKRFFLPTKLAQTFQIHIHTFYFLRSKIPY